MPLTMKPGTLTATVQQKSPWRLIMRVSGASVFLISESLCCQVASLLLPSNFDLSVRGSISECTRGASSGFCFV